MEASLLDVLSRHSASDVLNVLLVVMTARRDSDDNRRAVKAALAQIDPARARAWNYPDAAQTGP